MTTNDTARMLDREDATMALGEDPRQWLHRFPQAVEHAAASGKDGRLAQLLGEWGQLKLGTKLDESTVAMVREAGFQRAVAALSQRTDLSEKRRAAIAVLGKQTGENALENLTTAAQVAAGMVLKEAERIPGSR